MSGPTFRDEVELWIVKCDGYSTIETGTLLHGRNRQDDVAYSCWLTIRPTNSKTSGTLVWAQTIISNHDLFSTHSLTLPK